MYNLNRYFRGTATAIAVLLFLLSANISYAQKFIPKFKTVVVNGGVTDRCSVVIKYQRIVNSSDSDAFKKINRANRIDVFNEKAATTSDDIAIQDITAEMLDHYYEGMMFTPYYEALQTAHTIRNGKYVVFKTEVWTYWGGAHGYGYDKYRTYNLITGNLLDMGYIVTGSWTANVKQQLYNRCREKMGDEFNIPSESNMPLPATIELTDRGVTFVFQPYEIAPFGMGIIRIEFTDAELSRMGVPIRW